MTLLNEGLSNYRKTEIGGKEAIVHRDYSQPARAGQAKIFFNKGKVLGSQKALNLRPIERYKQNDSRVTRSLN